MILFVLNVFVKHSNHSLSIFRGVADFFWLGVHFSVSTFFYMNTKSESKAEPEIE